MLTKSQTDIPYSEIDFEIRELCRVLNKIDGIETTSSCCGHGTKPCEIYFSVDSIPVLNSLLHKCFNHEWKWKIYADMADPVLGSDTLEMLLTTDDITDEYFVQIMVDNLTYRIKSII